MADGSSKPLESVTVSVKGIVSTNGGGVIFNAVDVRDGGEYRVVVSYTLNMRTPKERETWRVDGSWKIFRGTKQLQACALWPVKPENQYVVYFLAYHKDMRGLRIGIATAGNLWKRFGPKLIQHLDDQNADALTDVLRPEQAKALCERWAECQEITAVAGWLQRNGLEPDMANRILKIYGSETITKMDEDPYRLTNFIRKGIREWLRVDKVGLKLKIARDSSKRLLGALEHVIYERLEDGHTFAEKDDLLLPLARRLGSQELALKAIAQGVLDKIIYEDVPGHYRHRGARLLENTLRDQVRAVLAGPPQIALVPSTVTASDVIDRVIQEEERAQGFLLGQGQKDAIRMAGRESLSLLLGGAGCGKTVGLRGIHRLHEAQGVPVFQMAIAGKAAQRMKLTTRRYAWTMERFIQGVRRGQIMVPHESLVIWDEASMVDLSTAVRLFGCLPPGCRVLLVGDPYQLPPVSFGLVYQVLARQLPPHMKVELTQVYRSEASSGIPQIALDIRNGAIPSNPAIRRYDTSNPIQKGVFFRQCDRKDEVPEAVFEIYGALQTLGENGLPTDDVQVLSVVKRGNDGVNVLNQFFQDHLIPGKDKIQDEVYRFAVGDPVIHLENDYAADLYNGSMGRIIGIDRQAQESVLRIHWDDDIIRNVSEKSFSALQLAYSITVHKAQGSQWTRVIVPIFGNRLLDRTMLYTALTRGADQVVLVGSWDAVEQAILSLPRASFRKVAFGVL